jgi:cytochrome c
LDRIADSSTIPSLEEARMTRIALVSAIAIALAALPAAANEELARKSGCLACHAVDKKIVGPSYQEVAAKYKGDKAAEAKLFKKVKEGGVGVWGQVPMPPNGHVKDEDIRTLVKWVLSRK